MSNTDVFGSPMILTGRKPVSPFGAAISARSGPDHSDRRWAEALRRLFEPLRRDRRIRKTVLELSRLDDRMLRDIGLNRTAITNAAQEADARSGRRCRR